jgi:hypothetical protein
MSKDTTTNTDAVALEDDTTGKTVQEKEKCFYARVESILSFTEQAVSYEDQVQFMLRLAPMKYDDYFKLPRLRVRSTLYQGETEIEYTQTLKIRNPTGAEDETTSLISKDFFDQFKSVADGAMAKRRYVLEIEGREEVWQIDVGSDAAGKAYNWVKIDYEFKSDKELPALPEYFLDVIDGATTDPEEKKFIKELYDTVFSVKN